MITLVQVTGGAGNVLQALQNDPDRPVALPIAMAVARNHAQRMALAELEELIRPQIQDAYDVYVMINGEFPGASADEWEAGIDDVIEKLFEPYQHDVGASWFGYEVIDTQLHKPVPTGGVDPITKLAKSFAKEVWANLTFVPEDKDTGQIARDMNAKEVLSAIGVDESDVAALIQTPAAPKPPPQAKEPVDMQELFKKSHTHLQHAFQQGMDHAALVAICDNALDTDPGLAAGGLWQLGLSLADKDALDEWALLQAGDAEQLANAIENADLPAAANDDEDLSAMMGGATVVASAPVPPPPALPPIPAAVAPPPAPAAAPKGKKPKAPVEGVVPPRVFKLLRDHIKVKDDDMGGMLGVSRQTYINYGKDNAKAQFVPSDEQRTLLTNLVTAHRDALNEALTLLGAA